MNEDIQTNKVFTNHNDNLQANSPEKPDFNKLKPVGKPPIYTSPNHIKTDIRKQKENTAHKLESERKIRHENKMRLSENQSLHSVSQPSLHLNRSNVDRQSLYSNRSKGDQQSCKSSNLSNRSYSSYRSNHMKGSEKTESHNTFKYGFSFLTIQS